MNFNFSDSLRADRAKQGTDSEKYIGTLFSMNKLPDRGLLPDLSLRKEKDFSFEVKSGKGSRGSLYASQVTYQYLNSVT